MPETHSSNGNSPDGKDVPDYLRDVESIEYMDVESPDEECELAPELPDLSYKPFSAASALREARKLQEPERSKTVKRLRQRLSWQKKGIGATIEKLHQEVRKDPDASRSELRKIVDDAAVRYALTYDHRLNFEIAIEKYAKRHEAVEKYRKLYPNDADLFAACFDVRPHGTVKVTKGPMTLCFTCEDKRDYITATTFQRNTLDPKKLEELQKRSESSIGMALHTVRPPELESTVTLVWPYYENGAGIGWREQHKTLVHEDQHQFNKLFIPVESYTYPQHLLKNATKHAVDPKDAIARTVRYLAKHQRTSIGIDTAARDEILAHYAQGASPGDIFNALNNASSYDYKNSLYYKDAVDQAPHSIASLATRHLRKVFVPEVDDETQALHWNVDIPTEDVRKGVEKVLNEGYLHDLRVWIDAIWRLEEKNYHREEILHLLMQEPIRSWHQLSRRMRRKPER